MTFAQRLVRTFKLTNFQCTGDGICEAPGDHYCTPQDNTCMSNCQKSSTTTAKATTKTTTISTLQTTTKPKPTTTTTSAGSAWTLVAYTGTVCDNDYYLLRGHKDQDSKCLDLPGDYEAGYDDPTAVYCKYFTDGGFSSSSCASASARQLLSWSLTGGVCTAYDTSCSEGGGTAISIDSQTGCQVDVMGRHIKMQWRSIRCQVN